MSRRTVRVVEAPMAVASDGEIVVNALHLTQHDDLDHVMRAARETGLPLFIGVVIPPAKRATFLKELDDAVSDVVGRLGGRLTASERGKTATSRRSRSRRA